MVKMVYSRTTNSEGQALPHWRVIVEVTIDHTPGLLTCLHIQNLPPELYGAGLNSATETTGKQQLLEFINNNPNPLPLEPHANAPLHLFVPTIDLSHGVNGFLTACNHVFKDNYKIIDISEKI